MNEADNVRANARRDIGRATDGTRFAETPGTVAATPEHFRDPPLWGGCWEGTRGKTNNLSVAVAEYFRGDCCGFVAPGDEVRLFRGGIDLRLEDAVLGKIRPTAAGLGANQVRDAEGMSGVEGSNDKDCIDRCAGNAVNDLELHRRSIKWPRTAGEASE